MKTIHLRFEKGFFVTHGLIFGISLFFTGIPPLVMSSGGFLLKLLPLLALLPLAVPWREWRNAVRVVDNEGLTRHDGRRFSWSDLQSIREVNAVSKWGQTGSLNHLDIFFNGGRARILPMVLENGYEAIRAIQKHHGKPAATAATAPTPPTPEEPVTAIGPSLPSDPKNCTLCGELGANHRAMQKHGSEDQDTELPPAAKNLKFVKDLRPGRTRSPEILRCPGCGSWFLRETRYEYLATGSEDEQELTRLSPEKAEELMKGTVDHG